jgi:hypothetical protein
MSDRNENAARAERKPWTYPYTADEIEAIAEGSVSLPIGATRKDAMRRIAYDYAAALRSTDADRPARAAKADRERVPTHGDYGGPLVRVVAHYEDGTEHSYGHDHPAIASVIDEHRKEVADVSSRRHRDVGRHPVDRAGADGELRRKPGGVSDETRAGDDALSVAAGPARAAPALTALLDAITKAFVARDGSIVGLSFSDVKLTECRAELAALTAERELEGRE